MFNFLTKKITRRQLDRFLIKYQTTVRILDIGSGGSSYARYFPNRFCVDIDPARNPDLVADAHCLPFADGEFEAILSTEMLEHTTNPKQVVNELMRVLKPGGRLILTTRFVYPLHDSPHDYFRFTKYGLKELFKDYQIVELVPETQSFSAIAALLQRLAFQGQFRFDKLVKFKLLVWAFCLSHLDWLIVREFGDIKKETVDDHLFTTGWYVVVQK